MNTPWTVSANLGHSIEKYNVLDSEGRIMTQVIHLTYHKPGEAKQIAEHIAKSASEYGEMVSSFPKLMDAHPDYVVDETDIESPMIKQTAWWSSLKLLMGRCGVPGYVKLYVKYARPFDGDDDEPPIAEVWSDGKRPDPKKNDFRTYFVSDVTVTAQGNEANNERLWDGVE